MPKSRSLPRCSAHLHLSSALASVAISWSVISTVAAAPTESLTGIVKVRENHSHHDQSEPMEYLLATDNQETVFVSFAPAFPIRPERLHGKRVTLTGTFTDSTNARRPGRLFTAEGTTAGLPPEPASPVVRRNAVAVQTPAEIGEWATAFPLPAVAINAAVLPTGRVLFWGRDPDLEPGIASTNTYEWNPADGTVQQNVNNHTYLFCAGQAFRRSGDLLVAGGHVGHDYNGSNHTDVYRPNSGWIPRADMNLGRWYPTVTALGNGEMLVAGGSYLENNNVVINNLPQVLTNSDAWRNLTGATAGIDWEFYPRMFLLPSGKVFVVGPAPDTWMLDPSGTGTLTKTNYTSQGGYRGYGTAVYYDRNKILIVGGPTNATAEAIDLNWSTPEWRYVRTMHYPRMYINASLLPDGKVFVSGGTASSTNNNTTAVYPGEMWDPDNEQWTLMARLSQPRLYHSTSVLLPDARVLVAGGGHPAAKISDDPNSERVPDGNRYNAEIFSPPYLFKGPRPRITFVSSRMNYGNSYAVSTPDSDTVGRLSLVRLSATTHSFDENQRIYFPAWQKGADRIRLTLPANRDELPPGHYMLFLINNVGVPSVARIVRIT